MIMRKVSRYDVRGKCILTKMEKYYLTDTGLGRVRNSGFKLEMGALLENIIYNELIVRGYDVYVGKTRKSEVDFVAVRGNEKEYYQVAYYLYDQKVIDREFGAFREIEDNYPKYVISLDKMDFSRDGIIHKNAVRFALKSPFSSAPTLPGLSCPGALCTGEFCGGTYAFSLVWWDSITSRK